MYVDARAKIDEIAERVLTLRSRPMSNLSTYLNVSSIEESESALTDTEMVRELLKAHGLLLSRMSAVINEASEVGDEGTIDLIGAYIRELEKTSWMLDAWNKDKVDKLLESIA